MTNSEKLDLLLNKVDTIETKVDALETKVDALETKVDALETKVDALETKVDALKTQVDALKTQVDALETDVREIKLTIENELRVSIKRVAEGHLDLSRHLNEAIEIHSEREMMAVRVSILETEVHKLKRQYENIA